MKNKLIILFLSLVVLSIAAAPVLAQLPFTVFDRLQVSQDSRMIGPVEIGSNLTIADNLIITPQTTISVTNGYTLTTTGGFHQLESGGTVTMTLLVPTVGSVVILENTVDTTINIADGNNVSLASAAALGQYDTLTLISDGRSLVDVSRSNN